MNKMFEIFEKALYEKYPEIEFERVPVTHIGYVHDNTIFKGNDGKNVFIGYFQTDGDNLRLYLDGSYIGRWLSSSGKSDLMIFNQFTTADADWTTYTWIFTGYMYRAKTKFLDYNNSPAGVELVSNYT